MNDQGNNITSAHSPLAIFFLHIPKTAGTSFRDIMHNIFPSNDILWLNEICGMSVMVTPLLQERMRQNTAKKNGWPLFVGGHFTINAVLEVVRDAGLSIQDVLIASLVRDPFDRFCSYHNFILSNKLHPLHSTLLDNPEQELAALSEFTQQVRCEQCYYISGGQNFREVETILSQVPILLANLTDIHILIEQMVTCTRKLETLTSLGSFFLQRSDLITYSANRNKSNIPYKIRYQQAFLQFKDFFYEDYKLFSFLSLNGGIYTTQYASRFLKNDS